jgi:hypothetical protein
VLTVGRYLYVTLLASSTFLFSSQLAALSTLHLIPYSFYFKTIITVFLVHSYVVQDVFRFMLSTLHNETLVRDITEPISLRKTALLQANGVDFAEKETVVVRARAPGSLNVFQL